MLIKTFIRTRSGLLVLLILFCTFFPLLGQAITPEDTGLEDSGITAGYVTGENPPSLTVFIGNTISVVLGLVGIALVILLIYGGVVWMTAMGDKERVITAKKVLTNAIIGLVVVVAAYAIASYVVGALAAAAT